MTTTTTPTRLSFGYNPGLPQAVTAAWGTRAIVTEAGGIDLVHNRQSAIGPRPKVRELTGALDAGVGDRWIGAATALLAAGVMSSRQADEFVLARTDGVIVKANTLGSGGYLYVCAYPDTPEPGTIAWARAEIDRLNAEHGNAITGAWFEAAQEVNRQITRPAFGQGELVLVERDGAPIRTGRFVKEAAPGGEPSGIAQVTLHEPYLGGRTLGHTIDVGLVMLASASPLAAADNVEQEPR